MKRLIPVALIIAVAVLILATTGGANKHHKAAQPAAAAAGRGDPAPGPAAPKSAIELRSTPLGKILVDAKGRSLYLFQADKPNMSNCSGACLSLWPALTSHGKPKADGGALAAKIGTISATGGKRQVTYNGHPLYYYAGDQNPGDTAGQGLKQFGAEWYVLAATGDKIDNG